MGQLSFWSADAHPRALRDLEGLLCGPGRAELFGRGSAARLTIVLGPPPEPEPEPEPAEDEEPEAGEEDEPRTSDAASPASTARIATCSSSRHAEAAPEPGPALDPDELAFLDLDPDEIAARLGQRPPARRDDVGVAPPGGRDDPGGGRRESRIAGTATCDPDPVTRWRARAVCCALRGRGVPAEIGWAEDGRPEVRTAFRADLVDLARAWTRGGGMKSVPPGFELDGPRLRLWVLAAGTLEGRAYTLGLDPDAPLAGDDLLTASHRAGLGASLAGAAGAPVLRIVGRRRHGRLGELVGRPPRDLADGVWPV